MAEAAPNVEGGNAMAAHAARCNHHRPTHARPGWLCVTQSLAGGSRSLVVHHLLTTSSWPAKSKNDHPGVRLAVEGLYATRVKWLTLDWMAAPVGCVAPRHPCTAAAAPERYRPRPAGVLCLGVCNLQWGAMAWAPAVALPNRFVLAKNCARGWRSGAHNL